MTKVEITDDMVLRATKRYMAIPGGQYNDRSFLSGDGSVVGFLGEEIFHALRPGADHVDRADCDFEVDGVKIEVKTKYTTAKADPAPHYLCSVATSSIHQSPDYLVFCSVYSPALNGDSYQFQHGWVLGAISIEKFRKKAKGIRPGQREGNNGYVCPEECMNVKIADLSPVRRK